MMGSLRVLVMALLASALFAVQSPSEFPNAPLVIAAEDGAGPWGQADGTGCGNDLVLAAYAAVNIPVRLEVMPYSRAKNGVVAGRYVACFGMAWTEELKGKVVFADRPLYSVTAMLIQNTSAPLRASSAQNLPMGTKVGTVFEYEYPPVFYELVKQGRIVPLASYGEVTTLKNLDLRRIDAALVVIDDLKNADYLINQAGLAGKVETAFSLGGQSTYLGFSTSHPQSDYARTKFNEGFALITQDGTLKRILDAWKAKQP